MKRPDPNEYGSYEELFYASLEHDRYWTRKAMRERGGSFVVALANAHERADWVNKYKLEDAFPEYFEEYSAFGMKLCEEAESESEDTV